jgi:Tfp pilus assembly protein PilO
MNTRQQQINRTLRQFYDKPVAKVSLELFFTVIAVIFFALFAIRPTLVTMSNLIKEIQDKEALDEKLKQKIASLSSVQGEFISIQDEVGILDNAIPSTPKFEEAISIIEKIASDVKLTIISLEAKEIPKEPTEPIDFEKAVRLRKVITLNVSGDYPSIRDFVDQVRNSQREISIDSIVFVVSDERGKKRLRTDITMSIHYFGIEAKASAKPSAKPAAQPTK